MLALDSFETAVEVGHERAPVLLIVVSFLNNAFDDNFLDDSLGGFCLFSRLLAVRLLGTLLVGFGTAGFHLLDDGRG